MKMPLRHISVLVDGAGYSGDQSALDGPKEAGVPSGDPCFIRMGRLVAR